MTTPFELFKRFGFTYIVLAMAWHVLWWGGLTYAGYLCLKHFGIIGG